MTGYGTHDDFNLYGSPHFIQVGEIQEEASSNSNDDDGLDNEDLNPDNEANYCLQLPPNSHALESCVDLIWNIPEPANQNDSIYSTASSFHDLVGVDENNEEEDSEDQDDPTIVPLLIPRSDDIDSQSDDDLSVAQATHGDHDTTPIDDIISNLA